MRQVRLLGKDIRVGCMHGTLQVTSLTRKAMGEADEGQGSAPGPRARGFALWPPTKGGAFGIHPFWLGRGRGTGPAGVPLFAPATSRVRRAAPQPAQSPSRAPTNGRVPRAWPS